MLTTVPVLSGWLGIDDSLSILALFHLSELELLSSLIVPEGHGQLVTLIVYKGLVWASEKALYL